MIQQFGIERLTAEERQKLIDYYTNLNDTGDYEEFCVAIAYTLSY